MRLQRNWATCIIELREIVKKSVTQVRGEGDKTEQGTVGRTRVEHHMLVACALWPEVAVNGPK